MIKNIVVPNLLESSLPTFTVGLYNTTSGLLLENKNVVLTTKLTKVTETATVSISRVSPTNKNFGYVANYEIDF